MGYTHYWGFNSPKKQKGNAEKTELLYKKAVLDCQKIIKHYYKEHGGLSGYSAHTKLGQYGGINLNGKGDEGHETFILREHFNQNDGFNFCKTRQKPYDVVVTACLSVLSYRLGSLIEVSSDGDGHDWLNGLELAEKVLKLKISNKIMRSNLEHPIKLGKNLKAV